MTDDVIAFENAFKTYPLRRLRRNGPAVRAIDDVSFSMARGQAVALVGESGSGKTTIGRVLVGLEHLTSGAVKYRGQNADSLRGAEYRKWRRGVQMIFQDPYESLDPRYRIFDLVAEGLRVGERRSSKQIAGDVSEAVTLAGLDPEPGFLQRYPHQLSGGQRQRIAIARAIVLRPSVLVADEPVSMLDVSVRAGVLRSIADLRKELSLALLFITHDLAVARYVSDSIMVMYLGRIVESGPAEEVVFRPRHPYTQLLLEVSPDVRKKQVGTIVAPPGKGSLLAPSQGCRFASRCPLATEKCRQQEPELEGATHRVACHYPDSLGAWSRQSAPASKK